MRKIIILSLILFSPLSHANWFADIVNRIEQTNGINTGILKSQNQSLDVQKDIRDMQGEILNSQKDIQGLMKQVNDSLKGNNGYGKMDSHDYATYGNNAKSWTSVLDMSKNGYGDGELGQNIRNAANQFPVEESRFNKGVSNPTQQKYYVLQAQTALATRAVSQLDYDKIQDQITYQQMLLKKIDETDNLKDATDLSNRIQVESNIISLQILRQIALSNQQQAVTAQSSVNSSLAHAKFLSKD